MAVSIFTEIERRQKKMTKPFESHGVEAEKAEAMRRYNGRRRFQSILRAAAVALLCYLWFPTVAVSLLAAADWFYRTGSVISTNRTVVFVFANLLVFLIFLLSRYRYDESSSSSSRSSDTEPDLYDEYMSSTAVILTEKVEEDESNKKIVPAEVVTTDSRGIYRRTKSETKKEVSLPVVEYRRTESANSAMERLSNEEFRLKVERFIMEKKMSLVHENGVVGGVVVSGYGSC